MNGAAQTILKVGTIFTGIFAGVMFVFALCVGRMLANLPAPLYVQTFQKFIHLRDTPPILLLLLMLGMATPMAAALLMSRREKDEGAAFRVTLAGLILFLIGGLLLTVYGARPIHIAALTWSPQAPPAEWQQIRDRWQMIALYRAVLTGSACLCYIVAQMKLRVASRQRA